MQTLVLIAVIHEFGDNGPFFRIFLIQSDELLILFRTPGLDFPLFGVQMLLSDLHVDPYTIKTLDRLHKLARTCFFHYLIIEEHSLIILSSSFIIPARKSFILLILDFSLISKEISFFIRKGIIVYKFVIVQMTTMESTVGVSKAEARSNENAENGREEHHYIGDYDTAPAFMKDNLHITHGYRINFNSPKKILKSLFMIHNESVNIWSHCLPAMIIIVFLLSFIFFIDGEAMRKSMNECQQQIQKGVNHYMHALDNLSLIAEYDTLTKRTKFEMEELKQTVMQNYQKFTQKFHESSTNFQSLLENQVEDIKSNIKVTLKSNLVKFERAKIEFERKIAPMLVSEFNTKVSSTWARELHEAIQNLKKSIDSDNFQYVELHEQRPNPHQISRWPIFVFLTSAGICMLCSTLFHLFYPMSSKTYTITNRFDYAGINLLIAGSAFPPLYYSMYCQLAVAIVYLSISFVIAVFCFIVCLFEWIHRPGHQKYKAFLFGGYGVSMLIPISHLIINELIYDNYGDPYKFSISLPYYLLLGASYLGGLYIYTVRCPERYNPGRYNLCGHSHQIWHGMVVLGVLFTYLGALENFESRKISACPA